MSSETVVIVVVLVLFTLMALQWEFDRPRRRARWDYLIEQAKKSDRQERP